MAKAEPIRAIVIYKLKKDFNGKNYIEDEKALITRIDEDQIHVISSRYNIDINLISSISVCFFEDHAKGAKVFINSDDVAKEMMEDGSILYRIASPQKKTIQLSNGKELSLTCIGLQKYINIHKPKRERRSFRFEQH